VRLQSSAANCGPTALTNAACAMGKRLSLEECEKICRTTATDGTSPRKLKNGAGRLGFEDIIEFRDGAEDIALLRLRDFVGNGSAVLITVDADTHWVAVVGLIGDRFLVADSADNELVLSYSAGEMLQRWRNPESKKCYYGMVIA